MEVSLETDWILAVSIGSYSLRSSKNTYVEIAGEAGRTPGSKERGE
jgi:hypothetical protein